MTMPKKDTTNALDDALFAANELLSIQVAADWPDSKPISNGLDDLTFGHLRVLRDAALTTAPNPQDAETPVYYCENGESLEGLEKGALAVLSNLMMKTNADKAEFMIANEKDGEFHFTAKWVKDKTNVNETDFVNPQPVSAALEALVSRATNKILSKKLFVCSNSSGDPVRQMHEGIKWGIEQALAQAGGQDKCFKIGDMVHISPNNPYYEDWKGVTLEIVGIYRDRGSKYQSPNTPPPIRYSVKDVKDSWTYGYTDDFSFEDLIAAPVSAKEG